LKQRLEARRLNRFQRDALQAQHRKTADRGVGPGRTTTTL